MSIPQDVSDRLLTEMGEAKAMIASLISTYGPTPLDRRMTSLEEKVHKQSQELEDKVKQISGLFMLISEKVSEVMQRVEALEARLPTSAPRDSEQQ